MLWNEHTDNTQKKITQSIIKTSSPDSVAVFFCSYFDFIFFLGRSMDGWIDVEMHQIFYILKVLNIEAKNMLKTKNYGLPFGNKKKEKKLKN